MMRSLFTIFKSKKMPLFSCKDKKSDINKAHLMAWGVLFISAHIKAADESVEFDTSLLNSLGQNIDLSHFSRADSIPPGQYPIHVKINGRDTLVQTVTVIDNEQAAPSFCFSQSDVMSWGVEINNLPDPELAKQLLTNECIEVEQLIPSGSFTMDLSSMSGELSIPQAYTGRIKRGYVSEQDWDNGVTAAFVRYNANVFNNQNKHSAASTNTNISLNSGANLGNWRLRHNGSYNHNNQSGGNYAALNSYAQRDISSVHAQLTLGEYFTTGDSFDSVPFTGIQLSSDDAMLPESERGFAPEIRGIADSNAKVTVRQGGNVLYETSVSPGEFVIDDLYATGYAGDLDVTVTEADGREKQFTVAFASVVQMLRPGASNFTAAAGQYRDDTNNESPWFLQSVYRRGINNLVTLYGGTILAKDYSSALFGTAVGTPFGAISLDSTFSHARNLSNLDLYQAKNTDSLSGQSYRVSYSHLLDYSQTNLSLAAYRFSSKGFLTLGDYVECNNTDGTGPQRGKTRFQVSISQQLQDWGSLYVNGITNTYWDSQASSKTFQLGLNKSLSWANVNVSANRVLTDGKAENTYLLSINVPLGTSLRRPSLNMSLNHSDNSSQSLRTSLSGAMGQDNQVNYGIYSNVSDQKSNNSLGANLQYRSNSANWGVNASRGENYQQYSASASGTLLAHSGGIISSPEQGETMAIIKAEGASGARLSNGQGNQLDSDGYALKAGLNPYRYNQIGIDPRGLPSNIELESTQQRIVPRRGAIVALDYKTQTGEPLLLKLSEQNIPFGASVIDDKGTIITQVAQGGMIFIRSESAYFDVVWGNQNGQQCRLSYEQNDVEQQQYLNIVNAQCIA